MKKALGLFLLAVVLAFSGCQFVPDVTYAEANDAGNGSSATAENAGTVATGSLAITGTISSESDDDYFLVAVGTSSVLNIEVLYNGQSQRGFLGISLFPCNIVTYDASDTILMNHLLVGGLSTVDLDAGTTYFTISVNGSSDYASGNYEIHLW